MSGNEFVRARGGDRRPEGEAYWFVYAGPNLLLARNGDGVAVPRTTLPADLDLSPIEPIYLGRLGGTPCLAAVLSTDAVPPGYAGHDLRSLYGLVPETHWSIAGLASQLNHWALNTRYCPRTGEPTRLKHGEWAMECASCDLLQYPHVSPCVIVLVQHGDRILMTRQSSWPEGRYGLVAGFVEPGESLEQCLAREVYEETGLAVTEMRYVASQPWPFPHQLMVGFTAQYAGGELAVDHNELEDARWFPVDALPILPPPLSIARRIIDAHVAALTGGNR